MNETVQKKERRQLPPVPPTRRLHSERDSLTNKLQLPTVPPRTYLQRGNRSETSIQSTSRSHTINNVNTIKTINKQNHQLNEKEVSFYYQLEKKLECFIPHFEQLNTPIKEQSLHPLVHRLMSIKGMITYLTSSNTLSGNALQQCILTENNGEYQSYCDMIEESINYIDRLFLGVLDTFGLDMNQLNTFQSYCESLLPSESEITLCQSCTDWKHLQTLRLEGMKHIEQSITKWKAIEQLQSQFPTVSFAELKGTGVIGWGRELEHTFVVDGWNDTEWISMSLLFTNDLLIIKSTEIHFLAFTTDIQFSSQPYGNQSLILLSCPSRHCSLYFISNTHHNTIMSLLKQSLQSSSTVPQIYQFPLEL